MQKKETKYRIKPRAAADAGKPKMVDGKCIEEAAQKAASTYIALVDNRRICKSSINQKRELVCTKYLVGGVYIQRREAWAAPRWEKAAA